MNYQNWSSWVATYFGITLQDVCHIALSHATPRIWENDIKQSLLLAYPMGEMSQGVALSTWSWKKKKKELKTKKQKKQKQK